MIREDDPVDEATITNRNQDRRRQIEESEKKNNTNRSQIDRCSERKEGLKL
ncbi:hypothetical protein C1H46_016748 [Malus baccata]|uniref:Uncharacterized protein n=1 Tax=Malus baccata TaxID=106549 RepID=A0A540MFZ4_MALBA|nr:hypothetical protein C1H46_016748 [Malus baccata]